MTATPGGDAHAAAASDERPHAPGAEALWNESWYFDFFDADASLGGYVRLGLYPNLGVAWYWGCLVGAGRPLVTVVDHEVPLPPPGSMEIRTEGLWADHTVETPLDHMSLGCEAFATGLDDPSEVYGAFRGDRVPFGLDLEWETDGGTFAYGVTTRYEVPCRVHGEVLVGDERIDFDGFGQRDHSWGTRDWWSMGWMWTAGRMAGGERFHATHVTVGDDPVFAIGYRQPVGGAMAAVADVQRSQHLGPHGLPRSGAVALDDLDLAIEPVAFSPVLLTGPDGRQARFPRALCRFRTPDGAVGAGWTEWNQPPG